MLLLIFAALAMLLAATIQAAVVKIGTAKDGLANNFYQHSKAREAHRSSIPTYDKTKWRELRRASQLTPS
jgi:hypothetical protein